MTPGRDDAVPIKLAVFGPDAAEAAQIRRIRSYLDCGFDVQGFTMRRENMNGDFTPFWQNIHLGNATNESPLRRVVAVFRAILTMTRHRRALADCNILVARNLDMLAIALAARTMMARPRPPVIYECLDIHGLMTDTGPKGRILRWIERRFLARTAALILSSPAFLRNYFAPCQKWSGPVALLENKLWIDGSVSLPRPTPRPAPDPAPHIPDAPVVLGWIGTLRCARSLAVLVGAAKALGPRLQIRMHGVVHHHALPAFDEVLARHSNIIYSGPYAYPIGLEEVYRGCDAVWSQDLWQWGTNSSWLLPNRIYEASYFGCPSIAVAGTETGRRVADGLGWTVPEPTSEALVALLDGLSRTDLNQARQQLLTRPAQDFVQSCDEIRDAIQLPLSRTITGTP